MNDKSDILNILRNISFKKGFSQRQMAKELGFSLGKLNYCIKALKEKGLIKIKNLRNKKDKIQYVRTYILTNKGINYRVNLTFEFMKKKMKEYDELRKEIKKNNLN